MLFISYNYTFYVSNLLLNHEWIIYFSHAWDVNLIVIFIYKWHSRESFISIIFTLKLQWSVALQCKSKHKQSSFFPFCLQDSSEIHFKVKMTTHLKKLKESYSQRQVRGKLHLSEPVTDWLELTPGHRGSAASFSRFRRRHVWFGVCFVFLTGRSSRHTKVPVRGAENLGQPDSKRGKLLFPKLRIISGKFWLQVLEMFYIMHSLKQAQRA